MPCKAVDDVSIERELTFIAARCGSHENVVPQEGSNTIGRAADATITLEFRGVSRYHARILVSGAEATLEDLGSKNGTRLNGVRIATPQCLSDGDEVRLGAKSATFRIAPPTTPTETVTTRVD